MSRFYTEEEKLAILHRLRIAPNNEGMIDGKEAAEIITQRAKREFKVDYHYNVTTIRQHVRKGHFPEGTINTDNPRRNLYKVDAVFALPIEPRRGITRKGKPGKKRKSEEQSAQV